MQLNVQIVLYEYNNECTCTGKLKTLKWYLRVLNSILESGVSEFSEARTTDNSDKTNDAENSLIDVFC